MIFIDTNILVYAHNIDDPFHPKAQEILADFFQANTPKVCLSPQILTEFFNVITNPLKINKPLSQAEVVAALEDFWFSPAIKKIFPPHDLFTKLIEFIKTQRLNGAAIFDAHIYLTMQANGVDSIMTANVAHFKRFHVKKIINPFQSPLSPSPTSSAS